MLSSTLFRMVIADLPDGCHGKVEFNKDGSEWEETSCCEQHIGMAGPVWRWDVSGNLVGPCGVCDNRLLCSNHSSCNIHQLHKCLLTHVLRCNSTAMHVVIVDTRRAHNETPFP